MYERGWLWTGQLFGFGVPNRRCFVVHGEASEETNGGVDKGRGGDEAVLFVAAPGKPAGEVEVVEQRDRGFAGGVVGDEDHWDTERRFTEVLGFECGVEQQFGLGGGLGFGVLDLFRHVYSPDSIMRSRRQLSRCPGESDCGICTLE